MTSDHIFVLILQGLGLIDIIAGTIYFIHMLYRMARKRYFLEARIAQLEHAQGILMNKADI